MVCNSLFGDHYDPQEFRMVCMMYASEQHIGYIDNLEKCLCIPENGIFVRRYNDRLTRYYPSVHGFCFNDEIAEMIGTYSVDGERVAFINTDGKTYVTYGLEFVSILEDAGFMKRNFIVPFDYGEEITDAEYARKWAKIAC